MPYLDDCGEFYLRLMAAKWVLMTLTRHLYHSLPCHLETTDNCTRISDQEITQYDPRNIKLYRIQIEYEKKMEYLFRLDKGFYPKYQQETEIKILNL